MRSLRYPVGVACLATGARRFLDLGDLMPAWAALTFAAAGAALVAVTPAPDSRAVPRARLAWLVPAVLALAAPDPLLKCAGGAALAAWVFGQLRLLPVTARLQMLALTLLVLHGAVLLVDLLALSRVSLAPLGWPTVIALRGLGTPAGLGGDAVHIETTRGFCGFLVQPASLGLVVHAAVATCVLARGWCEGRAVGVRILTVLALLAAVLIARFLAIIATGTFVEAGQPFDEPGLPMVALDWRATAAIDLAIAAATGPLWSRILPSRSRPGRCPSRAGILLAVVAGCCLTGDRILDCFGAPKSGGVVVDERHSRWEPTDLALGPDAYGTESGYNFRAWVDWVAQRYGPVRRLYEPLRDDLLEGVSVLVIKTPTEALDADERAALLRFVERGGGLLLIGDHTNVFGSSEVLNAIAAPLGFTFDYDCMFDHRRTFEQVFLPSGTARRDPRLAGVEALRFEVGCSLDIDSTRVRPVIVGRGLKSQRIDYTKSNFYPEVVDRPDARCGQFAQMVVRSVGRGRVAAISDSTIFSTFSVCLPGRRELLEATLHWLSFQDVGEGLRRHLQGVGWAALLLGIVLLRSAGTQRSCAWLLVVAATADGASAWAGRLYPVAPPIGNGRAAREVSFYSGSTQALWPTRGFVREARRNFDLFFQWTIRIGRFPRLVDDLDAALHADAPLVLVDPDMADLPTIARVADFVRRGNDLLLVETRPCRCVDEVAAAAGLEVAETGDLGPLRCAVGEIDLASDRPWRVLRGGTPLLFAGDHAVGVAAPLGEGTVTVFTCGDVFSNARYGGSFHVVPSEGLRRLYNVQFASMAAWE